MQDATTALRSSTQESPGFSRGECQCLTNYNSTMDEDLYRIYTLRDLGYDPYVMIYNKNSAPQEVRNLQRWCNNRRIFRKVLDFRDYDPKIA